MVTETYAMAHADNIYFSKSPLRSFHKTSSTKVVHLNWMAGIVLIASGITVVYGHKTSVS